ncbi:MAG TPA: FAD-dependent oxidoreductase, partial [Daejeonella sp.]|nr:FAD-dependent oxidoreductase [Daejeonella sp.]
MRTYDAIIIGSGQAGTPLAKKLANAGYKTALLERQHIGGTCINTGCTPTKTMIASARLAYLAQQARSFGIKVSDVTIDFKKVISRKDSIVKQFRDGSTRNLEKVPGLDIYYGEAAFSAEKTITLRSRGNKNIILKADQIYINAGGKTTIPEIKGIKEVDYLTSTTILDISTVPKHLLIVGGSYIALEFGQMFRRFGSKVTVVEQFPEFLSREDEDVSAELKEILEGEGITILTGTETRSLKTNPNGSITAVLIDNEHRKSITCSHVLIAAGRTPETEPLNLDLTGVSTNEKGYIKVNNNLETNVRGIFALGDIKGGPAFTHTSY